MYLTDNNIGDPPTDACVQFHADRHSGNPPYRRAENVAVPIPLAAFNSTNPAGRADVPQRAPGEGLDALNVTQLMYRLQYRNFGTHESWVTNFTVDVDATAAYQAGFRYVELRRALGSANPISANNEATFGPDTNDRWMGAAALDATGNLAIVKTAPAQPAKPNIFWRQVVGTPRGLAKVKDWAYARGPNGTFNRGRLLGHERRSGQRLYVLGRRRILSNR